MIRLFSIISACLLGSLTAFSQSITINIRISDADTLMVLVKGINRCDTAFTNNGKLSIRRKLILPELLNIICIKNKQSIQAIKENNERKMRSVDDGVSRELFLEEGDVNIHSSFADIKNVNIPLTKHATQDIYDEFRKRYTPLVRMARTIIDSSYKPKRSEQEKRVFDMMYEKINLIENEVAEKFVIENANNIAGAYILYRYCRIDNAKKLDSLYALFTPSLQKSVYLQNIKYKIKAMSALKTGEKVPEFSAVTHENKILSLALLKGKYAVLDFWGSWCVPCIKGFTKMREYYKKYGNQVEFIGVACNDKDAAWRDAIKQNELTWQHILNTEGINNMVVKYNIEAYPTKVLIDREGKLIRIFTGEMENFYQTLDSLFKN